MSDLYKEHTPPLHFLFFTYTSATSVTGWRSGRSNRTYKRWTGEVRCMWIIPSELTLDAGDQANRGQTCRPFSLHSQLKATPPDLSRRTWAPAQPSVTLTGLVPGQHGITINVYLAPKVPKGSKIRCVGLAHELNCALLGKQKHFMKSAEREGE